MIWTIGRTAHGKIRIDGDKHAVAEVFELHKGGAGKANASLIAAAPELLAACEAALARMSDINPDVWEDMLRAAIAKAKGIG